MINKQIKEYEIERETMNNQKKRITVRHPTVACDEIQHVSVDCNTLKYYILCGIIFM